MTKCLNLTRLDGIADFYPAFVSANQAYEALQILLAELPWRQDYIWLFNKRCAIPRLQHFQGDNGIRYCYSNLLLEAEPYHPLVKHFKVKVEQLTGYCFNSVLLNYYRDGRDSMGWHSDDEPALGVNPAVATLTLGAERCFKLRHKQSSCSDISLDLKHGSLLLMAGSMQHHWLHCVPQRRKITSPRISLTFRYIHSPSADAK